MAWHFKRYSKEAALADAERVAVSQVGAWWSISAATGSESMMPFRATLTTKPASLRNLTSTKPVTSRIYRARANKVFMVCSLFAFFCPPLELATIVAIISAMSTKRQARSPTFAEKLRQLRTDAGLSEAALAKLAGLTFATVHAYGYGARHPSFVAVVKIARALGVSVEVFADTVPITKKRRGNK